MQISVVVPTWNEEGNIYPLVKRIHTAITNEGWEYEIIFIDDNSTDSTWEKIQNLASNLPVYGFLKKGDQGKAFSLIEGFAKAKYPIVAMIDADLQYPPEEIIKMVNKIDDGADIVVANRENRENDALRQFVSVGFKTVFGKWLHHLDVDVQSGLKVFKKEVADRIRVDPTPWTFDLEFLLKARSAGYVITDIDITFGQRTWGKSKVDLIKTIREIGWGAIKMKFSPVDIVPLLDAEGFHFRGNKYIHHSTLPVEQSAVHQLSLGQMIGFIFLGTSLGVATLVNWHATIVVIFALITALYFGDLLFNLILIIRGLIIPTQNSPTLADLNLYQRNDWPTYTILCPLYKEASVVRQFVTAIDRLDYPKKKLQVMLLLEEDDKETIEKVQGMKLPKYFETVIVPDTQPKTKPKACNFGLLKARGEYTVIFDAEDIPEPLQLKKVVATFNKLGDRVKCVQAKLNFYNPQQNLLTKMFTIEYSLWFDLVLTGLQSIDAPIPLGGTSNHFRTEDLKSLRGWDAFNVTEDCDLGMRLAKSGYSTAIVDAVTLEEANSSYRNWFNQRTRWIKGYIQTYFVHNRNIKKQWRLQSRKKFAAFQLIVGGKILTMYINPIMWIITFAYFGFRATTAPFIESLFPPVVFYVGIFSMVTGNFLYMYNYMIGAVKRNQNELVKYALLIPFYWLFMSAAAFAAMYYFIAQPHHWAKTKHGLHIEEEEDTDFYPLPIPDWAIS